MGKGKLVTWGLLILALTLSSLIGSCLFFADTTRETTNPDLLPGAAFPTAEAAPGNIYYVAPDGDDSNPGTESQPWRTIQKAAAIMVGGDTVYVRGGTYNEQITPQNSGSSGNYITYQTYPGETVIIDGQNTKSHGFAINGRSYLIIDGFEMTNQVLRGVYISSSSHLIIRNNVVKDWGVFGIEGRDCSHIEIANNEVFSPGGDQSGIWFENSQHCDIHHNRAHDCPMNGIGMSHESDYNKIHHNLVCDNGFKYPQLWAGIALEVNSNYNYIYDNLVYNNKHAGLLTNSQYNYWYHNTVYSNPDSNGHGGGIYLCNWEDSTMDKNVFRDNIIIATGSNEYTVFVQQEIGKDNSFDYNIHWHVSQETRINWNLWVMSFSQWQNDYGQEPNGFNADPLIAGGDPLDPSFYKLQPNSPAIDAGADVGVIEDFDGNPRPQGAGYDIGAYEYTGVVQPTATPQPTSTPTPIPTATPTSAPPTPTPTPNPNELIIDNSDSEFSTSFSQDAWQEYTEVGGQHYGDTHYYNRQIGTGEDTATWSFTVPKPGRYEVYAWWWEGSWRPTDVPFTIEHLGDSTTVRVNQQINGGQWNLLGTFDFQSQGSVVVSDDVSSGRDVAADAVRLVYLGPLPSPPWFIYLPVVASNAAPLATAPAQPSPSMLWSRVWRLVWCLLGIR